MPRRISLSALYRCAGPALLLGLSQLAMADPIVPNKVRTFSVRSPGAPGEAPTPSAESSKVEVLAVRRSIAEGERDAGRPLHDAQSSPNAACDPDRKTIRTMPAAPGATSGVVFPDNRSVRTMPLHAQSQAPYAPDIAGSRASRGPATDRFADP
jgi:hypothetical protein